MGCQSSRRVKEPAVGAAPLDVDRSHDETEAAPPEHHDHGAAVEDINPGSTSADDILYSAQRQLLAEALALCHTRLVAGDVPSAEAALAAFLASTEGVSAELGAARSRKLVETLRASREYRATLPLLRQMEQVCEDALGGSLDQLDDGKGPFTLGADIKIDYASLGINIEELVKDAAMQSLLKKEGTVKVYYRLRGRTLDLKVLLTKYTELIEQRVYFMPQQGVFMMLLDGKASSDPLWKQFPPPSGTKELPGQNTTRMFALTQEHTSVTGLVTSIVGDRAIPEFIVKFVTAWLVPEIVRRLLKAGAACLKSGGPHWPHMQADSDGLYEKCRELIAGAPLADKMRGGKVFTPGEMPNADLVKGRAGNLLAFEASFVSGTCCWAQVPAGSTELAVSPTAAEDAAEALGMSLGIFNEDAFDDALEPSGVDTRPIMERSSPKSAGGLIDGLQVFCTCGC